MFETQGARGSKPETFRRRGQLLSCPPTTGLCVCVSLAQLKPMLRTFCLFGFFLAFVALPRFSLQMAENALYRDTRH